MPIRMSDEFEGFCLGLDIALSRDHANATTREESLKRLDDSILESLSCFDLGGLEKLRAFLSAVIESKNPGAEFEALWLSLKPTKVFFGPPKKAQQEDTGYIFIFKRARQIIEDEMASQHE